MGQLEEKWEKRLARHGLSLSADYQPTFNGQADGRWYSLTSAQSTVGWQELENFHLVGNVLHERDVPEWTQSDSTVRALILSRFPLLESNPGQRRHAGRWLRCIQLYFRCYWTSAEVAKELRISDNACRQLCLRIKRAGLPAPQVSGCAPVLEPSLGGTARARRRWGRYRCADTGSCHPVATSTSTYRAVPA